jgi:pimeloyl-ACP methyl ester carboxylesterase
MLARDDQVREESLWFGAAGRPLFGRLTSPLLETSRGGVLISPPIGREARLSRRALRSLAALLAIDGYVSLRFDHFATGNSSGSFDDVEFDRAWREGVEQGVALLRSLGVPSVSAVGMRLGATIIGAAALEHDLRLASVVLWDPCESGRTYLREASALGAIGREVEQPESGEPVQMLEYVYGVETAKRMGEVTLSPPANEPLAERVLMVLRDDRVISSKFRTRWTGHAEWATTSEQGPLLETELPTSLLPLSTMAQIREWLKAPEPLRVALTAAPLARDAVVVRSPNAQPVRESVVELGPRKLFGVLSEPVGDARGPLIVMANGINEDHVGPSRLWVDLSRHWAGSGLRCLRVDLRDSGESPALRSEPTPPMHYETWPDDVRDAISAVSSSGPADSVVIGLCSGAQLALDTALEYGTRGLCVINPQTGAGILRTAERLEKSDRRSLQSFLQFGKNILGRHRWIAKVLWQVSRLVLPTATSPRVRSKLVRNGTEVLILASLQDYSPFPRMPIVGSIDRRRLVSSEHFRVEIVPGMDHDFLSDVGRARALAILERHVLEMFLRVSPSSES